MKRIINLIVFYLIVPTILILPYRYYKEFTKSLQHGYIPDVSRQGSIR